MHAMNRRGFTFVELLVAMTLMGIVSVSIYNLLNNNQRVYREQAVRIDLNQNVRAAANILPAEIRELSATDPAGSDITAMTSSLISYSAMRSTYFVCAVNAAALQIVLSATPWYGTQALDVGEHLMLVYAEGDPLLRTDDAWLHVNPTVRVNGNACPAPNTASITLTLSGATAAQLANVTAGAPARTYKNVRVLRYVDASGAYWIGTTSQNKSTLAWGTLEPIVGPITSTGLSFTYYDANGAVTASTSAVARIAITVTGKTSELVRGQSGGLTYATSNIVTQVALRNNRRF